MPLAQATAPAAVLFCVWARRRRGCLGTGSGAASDGAAAFVSLRQAQERHGVGAVWGEGMGAGAGAKARVRNLEPKRQEEGKGEQDGGAPIIIVVL